MIAWIFNIYFLLVSWHGAGIPGEWAWNMLHPDNDREHSLMSAAYNAVY